MFILWRYIIKEHVGPFVFAMCVITLVFLLNLVFRELGRILSRGLSFGLILEFFFLNMAWIIALAVPMAVLVAALMAFGRFSGDSEITAMKAGGVSILYIISPVVILSIFLAFFLVWFNNNVLPDFNHRARLLATDIARKRPTISLEPGVMNKSLPNFNILVEELHETPDTSYIKHITIIDNSEKDKNKTIFAQSGKVYLNKENGLMIMLLFDSEMHELEMSDMTHYRRVTAPKQKISIAVPDMFLQRSESEYRGDREKSSRMMLDEVNEHKADILSRYKRIFQFIDAHFTRYLPGPVDTLQQKKQQPIKKTKPIPFWQEQKSASLQPARIKNDHRRLKQQITGELNVIENLERANYILMVEVHKKYSIPFACIVFVLVGAPLGIMARRGNLAVAGGISFGFFLLYWASLIGGEELADNQIISPFTAMWLANVIVGAGGVYLVIHSIHEATFIRWDTIAEKIKKLFSKS